MGKDGWAGAGKKLKKKFMQIVDGGKAFTKWIGSGFSRFIENFKAENKILGRTNWLALLNPIKTLPLLGKSFFPPAEMGESKPNTDGEDVSQSASYEDGGEEDTTVVVDGGGGDQAAAPASSGGGTQIIPVGVDKLTLVNSQYELQSTSALYKV